MEVIKERAKKAKKKIEKNKSVLSKKKTTKQPKTGGETKQEKRKHLKKTKKWTISSESEEDFVDNLCQDTSDDNEEFEADDYSSNDDLPLTQFTLKDNLKTQINNSKIPLKQELYYAVYFQNPDNYYLGRIVKLNNDGTCNMKFLHEGLNYTFTWNYHALEEKVNQNFIFYGPIKLGTYPFHVNELHLIRSAYKTFKKEIQNAEQNAM